MNGRDPLAAWRGNPFFLLEVSPQASRAEVERAGQRLIALLAVGSARVAHYHTPLGEATRDADAVRQALATLRDPNERAIAELWAQVADGACLPAENPAAPWTGAQAAIGWSAK